MLPDLVNGSSEREFRTYQPSSDGPNVQHTRFGAIDIASFRPKRPAGRFADRSSNPQRLQPRLPATRSGSGQPGRWARRCRSLRPAGSTRACRSTRSCASSPYRARAGDRPGRDGRGCRQIGPDSGSLVDGPALPITPAGRFNQGLQVDQVLDVVTVPSSCRRSARAQRPRLPAARSGSGEPGQRGEIFDRLIRHVEGYFSRNSPPSVGSSRDEVITSSYLVNALFRLRRYPRHRVCVVGTSHASNAHHRLSRFVDLTVLERTCTASVLLRGPLPKA
ncbi:MAG: hypothetical protein JWN70_6242 [Planctomycetaceae bacterium]|nr:hypothetical protein [Planctomycetaceae bacterium]